MSPVHSFVENSLFLNAFSAPFSKKLSLSSFSSQVRLQKLDTHHSEADIKPDTSIHGVTRIRFWDTKSTDLCSNCHRPNGAGSRILLDRLSFNYSTDRQCFIPCLHPEFSHSNTGSSLLSSNTNFSTIKLIIPFKCTTTRISCLG